VKHLVLTLVILILIISCGTDHKTENNLQEVYDKPVQVKTVIKVSGGYWVAEDTMAYIMVCSDSSLDTIYTYWRDGLSPCGPNNQ